MARGVARLNDRTIGTCNHPSHPPQVNMGGTIITASDNVTANNRGVARLNDSVQTDCNHFGEIITGSDNHTTNGRPTARLNDQVGGDYVAVIITASGDTNVN